MLPGGWTIPIVFFCGALPAGCSPFDWFGDGFRGMFDVAPPSRPSQRAATTRAAAERTLPSTRATAQRDLQQPSAGGEKHQPAPSWRGALPSLRESDRQRTAVAGQMGGTPPRSGDRGDATKRETRSMRRLQSTPGAPWTQEEQDAISETLRQIFESRRGEFESRYCSILGDDEYPCHLELFDPNVVEPTCTSEKMTSAASPPWLKCNEANVSKRVPQGAIPSVAKFLRLGFHDCIGYADGSGGCDGCLNFNKMFVVLNVDERNTDPNSTKSKADLPYALTNDSNANLAATADMLEAIYTNVNYGYQANVLTQSLQQLGKSRADLWAFAALRAIKWFVDRNNVFCQGEISGRWHPYADMFRDELGIDFPCEISGLRDLHFYTGRRDCLEEDKPPPGMRYRDFETAKPEKLPNPHASGKETLQWFKEVFDMNGRESVAAMGAHSVGTFFSSNHLFRYTWTGMELENDDLMNNLYYRMIAYRPMWTGSDLRQVADAKMQNQAVPPPSWIHWTMNPRCIATHGAPIQWHLNFVARAGSNLTLYTGGTHASFINPEMGLYLDFDTTFAGYPTRKNETHCTPLKDQGQWGCAKIKMYSGKAKETCLQTADGGDGKPTWEIVEEYADDQELWYHDFTLAMEKMLNNSYDDLTLAGTLPLVQVGVTQPPDPNCTRNWCCTGLTSGSVCCASTCNFCGGVGCGEQLGGEDACCVGNIKEQGRECEDKWDEKCLKPGTVVVETTTTTTTALNGTTTACPRSWCCTGIASKSVCCAASCGQCGGNNCKNRPGGAENCCTNNIKAANRDCEDKFDEVCLKPGTATTDVPTTITTTTTATTTTTTSTTTTTTTSISGTTTAATEEPLGCAALCSKTNDFCGSKNVEQECVQTYAGSDPKYWNCQWVDGTGCQKEWPSVTCNNLTADHCVTQTTTTTTTTTSTTTTTTTSISGTTTAATEEPLGCAALCSKTNDFCGSKNVEQECVQTYAGSDPKYWNCQWVDGTGCQKEWPSVTCNNFPADHCVTPTTILP